MISTSDVVSTEEQQQDERNECAIEGLMQNESRDKTQKRPPLSVYLALIASQPFELLILYLIASDGDCIDNNHGLLATNMASWVH